MVKHLALVHNPDYFPDRDYKSVADEITKRCDDIKVFIFPDMEVVPQLAELSENPLMTFCPSILHYFKAPRGKVFCGQKIRKDEQLRLLAKGGVRVPRWVYFKPHLQLSEREWGPFVIIKPVQFGYATKGRDIELVRTAAFKSLPLAMMKIEGRIQSVKIVQQFIDSGEHSEDFRVVTIFGRTLYALRRKSLVKLQRPEGSAIKTSEGVVSNAAAGTPREVAYCYDKEILAFAAACYRAIPQVPFQAVDIRRDINTGRLYCFEINPGGSTWNFSSRRAETVPTIEGIRREDQFGAWGIAAEALIEKTRVFAS